MIQFRQHQYNGWKLYAMDMPVATKGSRQNGWLRVLWLLQPPENDYPVPLLMRMWVGPNPGVEHPELSVKANIMVTGFQAHNKAWEPISPHLFKEFVDDDGDIHLFFGIVNPPDEGDIDMPDDIADFLRGLLDEDTDGDHDDNSV